MYICISCGFYLLKGDFNYNRFAQLSTFVLTNIAPQYQALNDGKLRQDWEKNFMHNFTQVFGW